MKSFTTTVLWIVFFGVLVVLEPHTAWAFRRMEPSVSWVIYGSFTSADLLSHVAACAFEAAIATLTHKLAKHIEATPVIKVSVKQADGSFVKAADQWATFKARYSNSFFFLLIGATCVSVLANLAHAVEYGTTLKIFTEWGIAPWVYSVAFGGALPLVSLGFANVLSNVAGDEGAPNPEVEEAKKVILGLRQAQTALRQQLTDSEARTAAAELRAREAEERFLAMGDVVKYLFGEDKKQRIIFARRQWPGLPNKAIAVIADASEGHVSETLREIEAPSPT